MCSLEPFVLKGTIIMSTPDDELLTLPIARQVLFLSFRFSQGSPQVQELLLVAVSLRCPSWSLTEEMAQAVVSLSGSIERLAQTGVHTPLGLHEASPGRTHALYRLPASRLRGSSTRTATLTTTSRRSSPGPYCTGDDSS